MKTNFIKCGNCLDLMTEIESKSIDLIVCDLPYGVTANEKDVVIPFAPLWAQYSRIIKDNGAICLFGQGAFFADIINSNRKLFRYDLVWDKELVTGFLNAKQSPLRRHEQIAVFYKKMPVYNPQFTEGAPLHSRGKVTAETQQTNRNYNPIKSAGDKRVGSTQKYPTSILKIKKDHPSIAVHPTQKPVAVYEWLIKTYTNPGAVVLDNCLGSGTAAVACIRTGRRYIGYDLSEEYIAIANERIAQEVNI